jgi:OmcA/MtrC family decaheme c-type cytochrome
MRDTDSLAKSADWSRLLFSLVAVFGALLAGCSGSTGAQGGAGAPGSTGPQGPPGPTGSVTALNVSTATQITATITSVSFPAAPAAVKPVAKFTLTNQVGEPLSGLTAANLGFAVAKLVPPGTQLAAVPPQTTAPAPQTSSQWQSYIYLTANPAAANSSTTTPVVGTTPQPQATVEAGASGTFVDNGDGTYQYTFSKDISKDPAVAYDPALTHRVGFEIRGIAPANSPVYTVQPSSGATTGITSREIVDDQTCKSCHQQLAFHGGARTEVQYCVMCHNPSSADPSSGNSLDFKVMFHKIHMGVNLPSVAAGGSYYIFGFRNSISDYSQIVFPTGDLRTCYTCHNEKDTAAPQTVDWRSNPSIEACSSCHDDVNFTTGKNHSAASLGNLTDGDCATCHGPTSTISTGTGPPTPPSTLLPGTLLRVDSVHAIPVRDFSKQFAYNIKSVATSTTASSLTFSVTDPTTAGHVWNILTDAPFTGANCPTADIGVLINWSTTDYTNTGSVVASEAQPARTSILCGKNPAGPPTNNGDGTFTVTLPAIPAGLKGSSGVVIDGFPAHDFQDGNGPTELAVPSQVGFATITDATPLARRNIVDVAKCDTCHGQLNAHGNHRVDSVQSCAACHNPNATDIAARLAVTPTPVTAANAPDGANEQPIDLKYMIHALHDGNVRAAAGAPYVVYHRGVFNDFRSITPYPGALNNCLACHATDTYYPQDPTTSTSLATTVNSNNNSVSPAGQMAITAATAACSACHTTQLANLHMTQNGGNFAAVKDVNSKVSSSETCVICHGPGALADVKVVHNLAQYQ